MKKFISIVMLSILSFGLLCVPAQAGAEIKPVVKTTKIDTIEPNFIQIKKTVQEEKRIGISKTTKVIVKPELQEEKTMYSDTIQVLVTDRIRNKIEEKLATLETEINMLAQVVYNEARGIPSNDDKAAVIWCILNRVDSSSFDNTIQEVITAPAAFAWSSKTIIEKRFTDLAEDVVARWLLEKEGYTEVGRVLPDNYFFFHGTGKVNCFKKENKSSNYWNWSLTSPYN
jgi:hypothetical protein